MTGNLYRSARRPAHRLDPRAKLLILLPAVVSFFLPVGLSALAVELLLVLLIALVSLGLRDTMAPVRLLVPLLVLIALLTPLFGQGGMPVFSLGRFYVITAGSLAEIYRLFCRLIGVSLLFYVFFRTTDMDEFVEALRWFGLPFGASLVVSLAFRWIPAMADLYRTVTEAHSLRRSGRAASGTLARLRELLPALTSVMIQAIKQIPALAMALENRGVGRSNRRSRFPESRTGLSLAVHLALAALFATLFLIPVVFGWEA